jgi:hypothetical protein
MALALKYRSTGVMMSGDEIEEKSDVPRKLTAAEKKREHILRVQRSLVACFMGIITGCISYLVIDPANILGFQSYTILALFIMLAGIVVQKHIFMLLKMNVSSLGKKDWFYQGFMTFAFWFIVWTILLSGSLM